ncbi:TAP-like protein-domain-containing protein [Apiospora saccharicola]
MVHPVRAKNTGLAIAATLAATAVAQNGTYSNHTTIHWGPCPGGAAAAPIVCGELPVPLDYTSNQTGEMLTLQLTKVPATAQPSRGSILLNFGGPGNDGRTLLAQYAPLLPLWVSFPAMPPFSCGTGNTIPFSCYQNETLRRAGQATVRSDRANSSDATPGRLWAEAQVLANDCGSALANTTGSLVGTAFTARDFMKVVDALGEDGLLRYWGFSYGTVLGSTLAAMFPDRIDRMVMDGIVNIHEWQHGLPVEAIVDYDKTFRAFLTACVANPNNCALVHGNGGNINRTATALETSIYDLLDRTKYAPFAVGSRLVDYTTIKSLIDAGLRSPPTWPELASILDACLGSNNTPDLSRLATLFANSTLFNTWNPPTEAYQGIRCSDQSFRATDPRALDAYYAAENRLSPPPGGGHRPRHPDAGDFRVRTRHPILLIGNAADPVTPMASARNASAGFAGSVVLEHKGFGHASVAQPSTCTLAKVRDYFTSGALPAPGTACEVDQPAFAPAPGNGTGPAANLRRALL